jgi:uncharacterized membrane protein
MIDLYLSYEDRNSQEANYYGFIFGCIDTIIAGIIAFYFAADAIQLLLVIILGGIIGEVFGHIVGAAYHHSKKTQINGDNLK